MNRVVRFALGSGIFVLGPLTTAACGSSSAPSPAAVVAQLSSAAAAEPAELSTPAATAVTSAASGAPVMDPCQKLTKADVQPFFTVPIVNELPEAFDTATLKGCSFSAAGPIATTLSIKVVGGDDAQTMELLQKSDTQEVTFTGVGVSAEHPHGSTEFTAQDGTPSNPTYCGVSTTGWKELAGKKDLADLTDIPDATATVIAQQYGTLCNKLFSTGTATPTMTVAAPTASASVHVAVGPILPIGGTLGAGFPLPQGLDCGGTKTVVDSDSTTCDVTSTAGRAIYDFYLSVLPTKGFTITHESEQKAPNGSEIASLLFNGPGAVGFSSLSIVGSDVEITLMKQ